MALLYTDLQTQILNYAQKEAYNTTTQSGDQNFTNAIPFFVNLALEKIYRDVSVIDKNKVLRAPISYPGYFIPKPKDWSQTISLYIGNSQFTVGSLFPRTPLFKRPYEFCLNFAGQTGAKPQFYADYFDNTTSTSQYFLAPTPDQQYYYELTYETLPPLLDPLSKPTNTTTFEDDWTMQKYPSLVFYASYIEALRYMGKGDEIPLYTGLYEQTVNSINNQNTARNVDRLSTLEKV